MGHTEVVNLVRAAPRVVDLVVGRVLEAPKPPVEAHLLPDICFKGSHEPLGKSQLSLIKLHIALFIVFPDVPSKLGTSQLSIILPLFYRQVWYWMAAATAFTVSCL